MDARVLDGQLASRTPQALRMQDVHEPLVAVRLIHQLDRREPYHHCAPQSPALGRLFSTCDSQLSSVHTADLLSQAI